VSNNKIIDAFEKIENVRCNEPLTYFEFGTLAALDILSNSQIDYLILEVGLGGRLDAVNVIDSDGSIITNIGLDHLDWLGDSREKIGHEKAGIMRVNTPTVYGELDPPNSIKNTAIGKGSDLILLGEDYCYENLSNGLWDWQGRYNKRENLESAYIKGSHQVKNISASLALLESLSITELPSERIINKAMKGIYLEGRLDLRFYRERNWLFDVAHNHDSAKILGDFLSKQKFRRCIFIFGIMSDKDIHRVIEELSKYATHWFIPRLEITRSMEPSELIKIIEENNKGSCSVNNSIAQSINMAIDTTSKDDLIVITGSFYVVSPALCYLKEAGKIENETRN
jgi:dihydrofolate synthase/folylpolyglutamate synthase